MSSCRCEPTERFDRRAPRAIALGGGGIDAAVLRAAGRRGGRRQPGARTDRIRDPAQPRAAGFTGTARAGASAQRRSRRACAAYARVARYPRPVDLAVIVVPGRAGARRRRRLHRQGRARDLRHQRRLRRIRRGRAARARPRSSSGCAPPACRLIGPNCMGMLNTDPAVRLNATFSPVYPPAGRRRDVDAERRAGAGDPRLRARG